MASLYTVTGALRDEDGRPAGRVVIEVRARGPAGARVVARGASTPLGRFAMTVASEGAPSLSLVFHGPWATPGPVVHVHEVRAESYVAGQHDAGVIELPLRGREPSPRRRPAPMLPEATLGGRVISIDGGLLSAAVERASSWVEVLTGFERLTEGVEIVVADDIVAEMRRRSPRRRGEGSLLDEALSQLTDRARGVATYGVYLYRARAVLLNRPMCEVNGFDVLCNVLAHELVHAGQHRALLEAEARVSHRGQVPCSLQYQALVEGHAYFVEELLRDRYLPLADELPVGASTLLSRVAAWGLELLRGRGAAAEVVASAELRELTARAISLFRVRFVRGQSCRFDPLLWKLLPCDCDEHQVRGEPLARAV